MREIETRLSIKDWTVNEFVDHMSLHVFEEEDAAERVFTALHRVQNVLFYGRGGYAKSMMAEVGLRMILPEDSFYDGSVFITSAGPGMAIEQFTGYLNMAKYKETGVWEMNMEDTIFLKCEYGIFEEGLSAPDKILFSLRDMLTRRKLCVNGVCRTNTLKSLFLCTNVAPKEWVASMPLKDRDSADATLKRFHFRKKIEWPDHSKERFERFFMHQRGDSNPLFAEMMAYANNEANYHISPRTALQMYDNVSDMGSLSSIKSFDELPDEIYQEFKAIEARAPYILKVVKICTFADGVNAKINAAVTSTELNQIAVDIMGAENAIKTMTIPSDAKLSEKLSQALRQLASAKSALVTQDESIL